MNSVTLIGRLGMDPEVRYIPSGTAVANFRLATTEVFRTKDGERRERTEWHNIVVWGRLAETVGKYCAKGRQVSIVGSLHTRSWDDRDGKTKHYRTEVTCKYIEFLDSNKTNGTAKVTSNVENKPAPIADEASRAFIPEAGMPPDEMLAQEAEMYVGEDH